MVPSSAGTRLCAVHFSEPCEGLPDPFYGLVDAVLVFDEGEADVVFAGGSEAYAGADGDFGLFE